MRQQAVWLKAVLLKLARPVVVCLVATLAAPAPGQQLDTEMLHRKQESQQRARDAARDLVSSVLDIQLQQLEENGLEELPLFSDIKQMRNNLDGLIEAEMAEVVGLLLKAQAQDPAERGPTFVAARQKIRDVVVRLSIERQNLLRRLKTAELAAHVKRLIAMQSLAYDVTRSLLELPQARQETQLLATIQDQRDIKALYLRLLETLGDVRNWGGNVGQGAAEGLSILRAAGVEDRIDAAVQELETAQFQPAISDEAAVLKGLRLLLEKIEETQGLVGTDRGLALETVRELIKDQEQLRDETKATELSAKTADPLVEKQTAIQKELGRLPDMLGQTPEASALVEQAKASAYEATGKLFDAKREAALEEQGKVLRNLATIERQLVAAEQQEDGQRSAAEFDPLVRDLERTAQDIKKAQDRTAQLQQTPPERNAQAAPQADKLAKDLAAVVPGRDLPEPVKARVNEAAESAAQAAAVLHEQPKNEPKKDAALATTAADLERAGAEVAAALADAKRMQLATRIGELNRAAEALDRAAAVERDVAAEAKKAAEAHGLAAQQAKDLSEQQETVREVAREVAQAVAQAAPDAANKLAAADRDLQAAEQALRQAAKQTDQPQQPKAAAGEKGPSATNEKGPAAPTEKGPAAPNEKGPNQADSTSTPGAKQANAPTGEKGEMNPEGASPKSGKPQPGEKQQTQKPGQQGEPAAPQKPSAKNGDPNGNPQPSENQKPGENGNPQPGEKQQSPKPGQKGEPGAPQKPSAKNGDPSGNPQPGENQKPGESQKPGENGASPAPGEPGPNDPAAAVAQKADAASEKLSEAARQLRGQIVESAQALRKEAAQQLAAVSPVRQDVEQAATKPQTSLAGKLDRLNQAQEKVRQAAGEQQRAAGRPEAAEAAQLGEQIAQAAAQQDQADEAAQNLAQGKAGTPLDAAARQQQAAETIERVAAAAATRPQAPAPGQGQGDELGDALEKAQQAAAQAAKQTLDGNHNQAQANRQAAGEALKQAKRLAAAEAERAQRAPAGTPDPAAQQRVTEAAQAAQQLAAEEAPAAAEALQAAAQASNAAAQLMEAKEPAAAQAAQQQTSGALAKAQAQLQQAEQELARQQAARMQAQSQQAGQMAARAAAVDPAGLAALRAAERHAAQAASPQTTPHESQAGEQAAAQDLERATVNLTAREEQIRRDEQLAAAIAQAAQQQQDAVDQIQSAGDALAQAMAQQQSAPPAGQPNGPGQPIPAGQQGAPPKASAAAQKAGQQLAQAMQQFAADEQQVGKAAEQIADQSKVTNPALLKALAAGDELAAGSEEPAEPGTPGSAQPKGQSAMPQPSPGMGQQFTPPSADATAQMVAGAEALAQLAELGPAQSQQAGAAQQGSPPGQPPSGQQAQKSQPGQDAASQAHAATDKSAQSNSGQQVPETEGGARAGDAQQGDRTFHEEPWVAKLPPELRQAIRAQSQRRPPRGYEERLRRYFENTD